MKSYALPGEDNKPFIAYLIPKEDDAATVIDNDQPRQVQLSQNLERDKYDMLCDVDAQYLIVSSILILKVLELA